MTQTVETTDQEKFEMYNKLDKYILIGMLIEANKHLDRLTLKPKVNNCLHTDDNTTSGNCIYCGEPKYKHYEFKII